MASSSLPPQGPLTTLFIPPDDCFGKFPKTWSTCTQFSGSTGSTTTTICSWSMPASCYPSGAGIVKNTIAGLNPWSTFGALPLSYHYSPGVLPPRYSSIALYITDDVTTQHGCLSGWSSNPYWCKSTTYGTLILEGKETTAEIAAFLPQIVVTWAKSDLQTFTPKSAPVLPTAKIEAYESSVAARTRASASTAKSTASASSSSSSSADTSGGLSTGAKAGIGVGVAVAVLLLLVFALLYLRKRRKHRPMNDGMRYEKNTEEAYGGRSHVYPKPELPSENQRYEMPARGHPPGAEAEASPPPVPIASKPRFERAELEARDDGS